MGHVTAMKLDGKLYRDEIFEDLAQRVSALKTRGIVPGLATVLVGDDPASHSYVKMKHRDCEQIGVNSIRRDLPADVSQERLNEVIDELNEDPNCTGYIVQLPLPKHLDENAVLERIDPAKDADGLHPVNLGKLVLNEPAPLPCTPHDVGVSRVDGKLAGDVHPDVWNVAGAVAPNPGGVGPLTRAFLVRNVVDRAESLAGLIGRS